MLNRDFSKSNKEYFKKNKFLLIAVAAFLLVGVLVFSIFGMKGNFEFTGYNEFSVTIGSEAKISTARQQVEEIVNSYNVGFDSISVMGEGDETCLVVRYTKQLNAGKQHEMNTSIVTKLELGAGDVTVHVEVEPIVRASDYVYTAVIILILITLASIFAYFRYNGASAITLIISTVLGTLGYISLGAILRLTIGLSYFAMLTILNMLIVYVCFDIFENIRTSSYMHNGEYGKALSTSMNSSKLRMEVISIAMFVIGLLFVLLAPTPIKYVSLNLMFIPVVLLAVALYVLPFCWSALITFSSKRTYKKVETTTEVKE